MLRQIGILSVAICIGFVAVAQDTLPSFTLVDKGNNRIVISWTNPYDKAIRQLSIQRSFDSAKNFKSILTLPDPTVAQNGYVDTKATSEHMFYRLYILLDSGKYIFSKAKKPVADTQRIKEQPKEPKPEQVKPENTKPVEQRIYEEPKPAEKIARPPATADHLIYIKKRETIVGQIAERSVRHFKDSIFSRTKDTFNFNSPDTIVIKPFVFKEIPERIIFIKRRDTLIGQVGERSLKRFRDSVSLRTRDTIGYNTADTIVIKPFVPKEVYTPSKYVFTEKDGNVRIALPDAAEKKYTIRFFDETNTAALEIKQIKDAVLTLDKSNFLHAGWFKFELYEEGKLKEKNKLFVPKDF